MSSAGDLIICKPRPISEARLTWYFQDAGHVWVQPKLKGMHLLWDGEWLLSSLGNAVLGLPHVVDELQMYFPGHVYVGEAYCHGMSEGQIAGICRSKEPSEGHRLVGMHIFDAPAPGVLAGERLRRLMVPGVAKHLHLVHSVRANSAEDVRAYLRAYLAAGYEGVVIRHPGGIWEPGYSKWLMKWKPHGRDEYQIKPGNEPGKRITARGEGGAEFSLKLNSRNKCPDFGCRVKVSYPCLASKSLRGTTIARIAALASGAKEGGA